MDKTAFGKNKRKNFFILIGIVVALGLSMVLFFIVQSRDYEIEVFTDHVEIVKYIGDDEDVVIPNRMWGKKVTVLRDTAFFDARLKLKSVVLPKHLEIIEPWVFVDCSKLETVMFNDNLTEIGDSAFANCYNLKSLELGVHTKTLECGAFNDCKNLKNVQLNEGLAEIGSFAFEGAEELESIVIPKSVEKIGRLAFSNSGLKSVTFQGENAHIGKRAFEYTEWQDSQEGFLIYGDKVLIEYNGEEEIVRIPDGVKYITCGMYDEKSVKEIYVPNTVISIDESAAFFRKEIVTYVPASVTEIVGIHEKASYDSDYYKEVHVVTTADSYMEEVANKYGMQCTIVDEIIYPEEK